MPYFDPNYFDQSYFDTGSGGVSGSGGGVSGATATLMIGFKAHGGGESNNNVQLNPEYFVSSISEAINSNTAQPSPYYNIILVSEAKSTTKLIIGYYELDVERFDKANHIDIGDYVLIFNRRT